jgi:hypothetical protein
MKVKEDVLFTKIRHTIFAIGHPGIFSLARWFVDSHGIPQ